MTDTSTNRSQAPQSVHPTFTAETIEAAADALHAIATLNRSGGYDKLIGDKAMIESLLGRLNTRELRAMLHFTLTELWEYTHSFATRNALSHRVYLYLIVSNNAEFMDKLRAGHDDVAKNVEELLDVVGIREVIEIMKAWRLFDKMDFGFIPGELVGNRELLEVTTFQSLYTLYTMVLTAAGRNEQSARGHIEALRHSTEMLDEAAIGAMLDEAATGGMPDDEAQGGAFSDRA